MIAIPISAYPLHKGHVALFETVAGMFTSSYVTFLIADNPEKEYVYDRMQFFQDNQIYPAYKVDGLVGDYCRQHGVDCLARGIRDSTDFEYEKRLSDFNLHNFGVRTIFVPARNDVQHISSTAIRELLKYGMFQTASNMCPEGMEYALRALEEYYSQKRKECQNV